MLHKNNQNAQRDSTKNKCPICTPWCATSETQLKNRLANMRDFAGSGTDPYPCPRCGSMAWATTRAFIKEDTRPRSRWRRLMDRIRR